MYEIAYHGTVHDDDDDDDVLQPNSELYGCRRPDGYLNLCHRKTFLLNFFLSLSLSLVKKTRVIKHT